MFNTVLQR